MWSAVNFIKLGKYWGEVITIANETAKGLSFDLGKIFINSAEMGLINKVMEIENKGEVYTIRVIEEQMIINTFLKADCNFWAVKCKDPGVKIRAVQMTRKVKGRMEQGN